VIVVDLIMKAQSGASDGPDYRKDRQRAIGAYLVILDGLKIPLQRHPNELISWSGAQVSTHASAKIWKAGAGDLVESCP